MKKALQILMLLAAVTMSAGLRAQGTLTVCNGTDTNEYVPIYGYYADDEQTSQMIFPASMLTSMQGSAIEQMAFYVSYDGNYDADLGDWNVSLGITTATTLSALDETTPVTQVYSGPLVFDAATNATMMYVIFSSPFVYNGGNLLVEFDHPEEADYNHYSFYGVAASAASYSWDSVFDFLPKTTFTYASCARPGNLSVPYVTTTTATISWTGNAASYDYVLLSATGGPIVTGTTALPVANLTGLTAFTNYIFSVRAHCSATDTSAWSIFDFRTAMCDDGCPITIEMHDASSDGWDGGAILAIVDSLTADTVARITLENGDSNTVSLSLCNGRDYIISWVMGSYMYNYEDSYIIYALDGTVIDSATNPTEGRHGAFTHVCPTVASDSVFFSLTVNDASMGTTNPAPGSYAYGVGDAVSLEAIPAEGYSFSHWTVVAMGQTLTFYQNPYTDTIPAMLGGMTISVRANFTAGETSDSITVVVSVNDPDMGTTRPAPGTYRFAVGDSVTLTAIPLGEDHYFANWTVSMDLLPIPFTRTDNPLSFGFEEYTAGMTFTLVANFTDDTTQIDNNVHFYVDVNDSTMGYTVPGTGRHDYGVGENPLFTAYPNEGYDFVGWYIEAFDEGDTLFENPLYPFEGGILDMYIGWEVSLTALFRPTNGIEAAGAAGAQVFGRDGVIVVRGAAQQPLRVYDLMGRLLFFADKAAEEQTFRPATAGVYLVTVGDQPARRVVVR